ncbi:nocardicin N-oxygenase [Archangium gephyra]|uniref:Nocardicin N-oxygenase n=2 Tax=Archangium gephyra TaxID=48 RepID=A0ABX9K259_9BACT|nr:nocardicin N-oxygenase [Archangium gephyra]
MSTRNSGRGNAQALPGTPPHYPFGPVRALDLHPRYAELCREEPVSRVRMPFGGDAWLLTGYAEIKQFLADPRFSSLEATQPDTARVTPLPLRPGNLLTMDPPDHTRIRRVVVKAFSMRRVEQLRDRIREVVDEQLDQLVARGPPADLVASLAVPMPVVMISELLGIPSADRERFRRHSDVLVSTTAYDAAEVNRTRTALEEYFQELLEQRRSRPTDDLVSTLLEAMDTERLTPLETARTGVGILMAGHETSLSMISNSCFLLLSQRELYARLVAEPSLLPTAIEELLRYIPLRSTGSFPRRATEDVELGGVLIRKGETVIFQRAAADRDERVFTCPEKIDLARRPNPHLGFGHGAHHCLGAALARVELSLALEGLIRRFPDLRLAVPGDQVPWKPGLIARCPARLEVTW